MDDIAARRAKLLGLPSEKKDSTMEIMESLTKAQSVNAELAEALCSTVMTLREVSKPWQEAESSAVAAVRAELTACQAMLMAECESRAKLEGEVAALREAASRPIQTQAPIVQSIDTKALVSSIVAAIPKPQPQIEPQRAKFFNLDIKDSMGNPRRVRVTPEY